MLKNLIIKEIEEIEKTMIKSRLAMKDFKNKVKYGYIDNNKELYLEKEKIKDICRNIINSVDKIE